MIDGNNRRAAHVLIVAVCFGSFIYCTFLTTGRPTQAKVDTRCTSAFICPAAAIGAADTIVATESFVTEMDAVQYDLKQGPCISAVAGEQLVISGSIALDPRWPEFGPQSAGFGVQSSLSVPLITSDGVVGSLNVYAHEKDVFDDRAALLGGYFGVPAAIVVQNAQILAESRRLALHLRKALSNRITVERAIGVLMTRSGESPDEAMAKIRTISHTEHKKIDLVAQNIVDTAVRRAHARRIG